METGLWMEGFLSAMEAAFGGRLVCVGLQGSRGRGEETFQSDIDVVVILDHLTLEDLDAYRRAAADLPEREKLCGFVSGRGELAHWDGADLFQFYHDTRPLLGSLDFLLPRIGTAEVRRAAHRGACDLYHACCHNYLHRREGAVLAGCCKGAFFVLQAKHFLETGVYVGQKAALLPRLSGADRAVLAALLEGSFQGERFPAVSGLVLDWASGVIRDLAED